MKTRKLRLVSALLVLAMLLAMVPVGAFAESDNTSNLVTVPEDELVIDSAGVFSGINSNWLLQFKSENPDKLLKVVIPSSATKIADDVFRSGRSLGNNVLIGPIIGAVDFSQSTKLESIGEYAFSEQTNLSGELDLSKTSVTVISKSAFNTTTITGVILPSTLQTLGAADAKSGSSFANCSKLMYVRTADGDSNATFELPNTLTSIGKDTFRSSFAQSVKLKLPATVTTVGSQAFHSNKIEEIIVNYDGDFANYHAQAFLSNKLVVFKNKTAYDTFYKKAVSTTRSSLTYPIELTFVGTSIHQDKLHNQSIQYEKDASGFWTLNSNYTLPDASSNPSIPVGFTAKWMLNGSDLTTTSKINATNDAGDTAEATYNLTLQAPTVEYTKNGVVQPNNQIDVTLTKSKEQTVGVKLSHPLLDKQLSNDEDIAIFYYWFDYKDFQSGPRNNAESNIFGKYNKSLSEIPITKTEDTRNSSDAYWVYFQLGYQKGSDIYWYKETSTPRVLYVTVTQPDEYTISYDLNGGTAADGVIYDDKYVVVGSSFTAEAAPTKDGYTFTGWSDGTNTYKAGETIIPVGNMTLTAQWKEAPTPVVPDPEPAKTYPISSDFGKLTDQKDGGSIVSNASKGQRIYISLPEDKQTQGNMKFTYWDVQPESLKDALIASGFDPYSTETSFEMPELADGQTLTINPHYEPMDSDSGDDSFLMTAAAVAGGAALTGFVAWQGYNIFAEVYMKQALPAGAVLPQSRQELALLLWNKAGNPAPADSTLYTDVDAANADAQAAARWAVENELLKPADKKDSNVFKPEKSVSVGQVYRAWKKAEALG